MVHGKNKLLAIDKYTDFVRFAIFIKTILIINKEERSKQRRIPEIQFHTCGYG